MLYKLTNIISNFWRVVNKYTLIAIALLLGIGIILVASSGQVIASRIGVSALYFANKQLIYLPISIFIILFVSTLNERRIRNIGILGYSINIVFLILVLFYGNEIKGASRWLTIAGVSVQPSELVKPFLIITIAWCLSKSYHNNFPGIFISLILYLITVMLISLQPDFGMMMMISCIIGSQFFIAGMPFAWIVSAGAFIASMTLAAFTYLPHVAHRINSFLDGNKQNYQVSKSILAFEQGGLYGVGPGEGLIKQVLPDCHTDFIFAVAGEEFGSIACVVIASLFIFIVIYNLCRIQLETDRFKIYTVVGIITQFGLQACFNMCVALGLVPTKGMTLPLISYGGSSMIAISFSLGILLAFTQRKVYINKFKDNIW